MTDRRIRILLVDDHEAMRLGLRYVLEAEPDLDVIGEADTASRAVATAARLRPDLVLLDVFLPDRGGIESSERSGVEACREIRAADKDIRVLMLTSATDEIAVRSAVMAGANGYLLKNAQRAEMLAAVRAVAAGASLFDPAVAKTVQELLANPGSVPKRGDGALSEREREVIALVAEGLTNREIAERLVISEKTARNHVSNIFDKLGLTRRSEAAAYAVRHGLAPDQPGGC